MIMPYKPKYLKESSGRVISIQDNIIIASGLNNTFLGEVVKFKTPGSEIIGQVLNLEKNLIRIIIIKKSKSEILYISLNYFMNVFLKLLKIKVKNNNVLFYMRCKFFGRAKANFNKFKMSRMIFKKYKKNLINLFFI